jgi:hypothetical protein
LNHRKFLFKLKLWARLFQARRSFRRVQRVVVQIKKAHEKELSSVRSHYELLLAEERLKVQTLALTLADRVCEAKGLMSVSHTLSNLQDKAERTVDPHYQPPAPDPEDSLSEDEHNYFLDLKDGFFEAEKWRGEAEITRLWNETFKFKAISQAKESILQ